MRGSGRGRTWATPWRWRSRAWLALLLGAISLAAAAVGLAQYVLRGVVTIRPGHAPMVGAEALQALAALALVGAAFLGYAALLRCRARRLSARLRTRRRGASSDEECERRG